MKEVEVDFEGVKQKWNSGVQIKNAATLRPAGAQECVLICAKGANSLSTTYK